MSLRKRLALTVSVTALVGGVLSVPAAAAAPAPETVSGSSATALGPCNYSGSHPVLSRGSTGSAVRHAQCLLNRVWGYSAVDIDGIFGEVTETAVTIMQVRCRIADDGIIGPNTWACLHP
ncbi:peptidoglycan-binding protein [Streptomyces coelicoflavus]|uniref:peptidoglycan-binding domain-containing protein n=1 Tax=Streptomyces coelicoflavus TaxID=285562 RepID=UPI0006B8F308